MSSCIVLRIKPGVINMYYNTTLTCTDYSRLYDNKIDIALLQQFVVSLNCHRSTGRVDETAKRLNEMLNVC